MPWFPEEKTPMSAFAGCALQQRYPNGGRYRLRLCGGVPGAGDHHRIGVRWMAAPDFPLTDLMVPLFCGFCEEACRSTTRSSAKRRPAGRNAAVGDRYRRRSLTRGLTTQVPM
jgi:hypothetical protein